MKYIVFIKGSHAVVLSSSKLRLLNNCNFKKTKARFRRRISHVPNVVPIWVGDEDGGVSFLSCKV